MVIGAHEKKKNAMEHEGQHPISDLEWNLTIESTVK